MKITGISAKNLGLILGNSVKSTQIISYRRLHQYPRQKSGSNQTERLAYAHYATQISSFSTKYLINHEKLRWQICASTSRRLHHRRHHHHPSGCECKLSKRNTLMLLLLHQLLYRLIWITDLTLIACRPPWQPAAPKRYLISVALTPVESFGLESSGWNSRCVGEYSSLLSSIKVTAEIWRLLSVRLTGWPVVPAFSPRGTLPSILYSPYIVCKMSACWFCSRTELFTGFATNNFLSAHEST